VQDELRAVCEGLAARLQRPVAIDDPRMHLLVHTAHDERLDKVDQTRITSVLTMSIPKDVLEHVMKSGIAKAEGPVRVPAWPARELLSRVAVPVRCGGRLFGYLWLIDDDYSLTDEELQMAADAANAAGQIMHRELLLGDLRRSREQALLRDLVSQDSTIRAHASAELTATDRLPASGHVILFAVRVAADVLERRPGTAAELDLALQRLVRQLMPMEAIAVTRSGGHGLLLAASLRPPTLDNMRAHARRLCAEVGSHAGTPGALRVGIGPVVCGLDAASTSCALAEVSLRVAEAIPGFGQVVCYDELGIYGLLVHLPLDRLPPDAVPAGLRQLIEKDAGGQLIDTLEVYLDQAGDARASAALLNVHRTSLYYRLSRIEQVTTMNLASGGDRLSLHLGLKLARLLGLLPNSSKAVLAHHGAAGRGVDRALA
jgi:PucR C-terminal helix-turn-helix domain/GGDEF-like domain